VGVGWTLNFEMFFYLVFAVALFFERLAAIITVTTFLIGLVTLGWLGLPAQFGYWSKPIVLEFVLGMWLGLAYAEGVHLRATVRVGLCLIGVALLICGGKIGFYATPLVDPGRVLAWGVPSALIVAGVSLRRSGVATSKVMSAASAVGDASYAIYLVHPLVGFLISGFIWRVVARTALPVLAMLSLPADLTRLNTIAAWGETIIGLGVIVALSLAIFYLVERPATTFMRKTLSRIRNLPLTDRNKESLQLMRSPQRETGH
jgi:exopolysaccharide production protein ExoZ